MKRRVGFTIVEVVIAVTVIAILAAIVLVGYSAVQAKARDTQRTSQLASIGEALTSYRLKYGDSATASCSGGSSNAWFTTGEGWFDSATYSSSILSCLNAKGYLDRSFVDPTGCADTSGTAAAGMTCKNKGYAYAKSTCVDPSNSNQTITILMARLEQSGNVANLQGSNALCDSATWATNYGLNYMIRVD